MNTADLRIGVIISTYNNPVYLERVLDGYTHQTDLPSEIIIADDGSREDTRQMIEAFSTHCSIPIKHVWHPDNGFQKCTILNKAIVASESEYLIFTDHDCIPREDFVATHRKYAQRGKMLSGGYSKLSQRTSEIICRDKVPHAQIFSLSWLHKNGLSYNFRNTKLWRNLFYAWLMNHITPANASWNGCNSSGWKSDIIDVNGFNQNMQYGGLDRELGERLNNLGIKGKQIRYSAIVIHLFHERPYKTDATMEKNHNIRKHVRKTGIIRTPNGIEQLS